MDLTNYFLYICLKIFFALNLQFIAAKTAFNKFLIWKYPIKGIVTTKTFELNAILTICLFPLYLLSKTLIFPEVEPIVNFFIFPKILAGLRRFEKRFINLPIGAQYGLFTHKRQN